MCGARAAYIAGCSSTSCVMAARDFGIPASGTMAHSWVQMFPSEYEAFKKYAELYPEGCALLVDTYNVTKSGVPNAIRVFDEVLAPPGQAPEGRPHRLGRYRLSFEKGPQTAGRGGLRGLRHLRLNSLDEYIVRDLILQDAKVGSFGIGENLITAKSDPVFGGVYKLAAIKEDGRYIPKIKVSGALKSSPPPFEGGLAHLRQ